MTERQYLDNLSMPEGKVDVVIDTDTYNEIDDQFAIAYLLRSKQKLNTVALYAAPFYNANSIGPADGMEKSYNEILKILKLMGEDALIPYSFKGSDDFLHDENTPIVSEAANDLIKRSENYSAEHPLYVVAIGAITNIASALLLDPKLKERIVVVWLGGHARHLESDCASEFNMVHDIAAARIVMGCGVPFVQLPCRGVVSAFTVSGAELRYWLKGKNPLADYLAENTIRAVEGDPNRYSRAWTRVIWDVTAVAWLINENERFMHSRILPVRMPEYDRSYSKEELPRMMCYVDLIKRDALVCDLFKKLTEN